MLKLSIFHYTIDKGGTYMEQIQIGSFLKKLRKEKGITQEQFAEVLNVSARTISRWENGNNMPDISLLIKIADFFDVSIPEIINGERKNENMEEEIKEIAESLTNYADVEKNILLKRVRLISILGLITLLLGLSMEFIQANSQIPIYESIKGICLGFSIGSLITMVLYTSGILTKIQKKQKKHMKLLFSILCAIVTICIITSLIASFT